ncbi:MAG: hypothetical protein ACK4KT_01970 [Thermaurantimonas sp.]
MMDLEIDLAPQAINIWKDKRILILADEMYKYISDSLIQSDMFLPHYHDLFICKNELIFVENRSVKITSFSIFFTKRLLKKLGISDKHYDVILYLGEDARMLRLVEKWCRNKGFVYIGKKESKCSLVHFVPEDQSKNTANSFISILNKISL